MDVPGLKAADKRSLNISSYQNAMKLSKMIKLVSKFLRSQLKELSIGQI